MFGKLKLWRYDGYGNYAAGSWLVAAKDEEQAKEILKDETDNFKNWDWSFQRVPGEISGVDPGVIHDFAYIE